MRIYRGPSAVACALIALTTIYGQTPPTPPPTQAGAAQATPPPKVTTPDVKIPSPLNLPGPTQTQIGAQPLMLNEALAIALKTQPQVNIARADLLSAQGKVQEAASGLFPQFGANASYNNQATIRNSDPVPSPFTASVSVQQLLFDFGRTRDQVRQQSSLERSSKWNLTRTQQMVALQVKLNFYTLVMDLSNVQTSEADAATRQAELDLANARMNAGLGAPADVLQAKTTLAASAVSLSSARSTALSARVALAMSMGINPQTPIEPAPAKEVVLDTEGDIQKLVAAAMTDRPDIKSAKEQVAAAGYAVSFAMKGNVPRVDLVGGVNGRGQNGPFDNQVTTYGISVSWQFGDGGLTAGQVKEAKGNEESAKQMLIDVTNQAVSDVSSAFVDLQSATQRLELSKVAVANAKELVRVDEGRYMGGIGQFLDVTTAQSSLLSAEQSLNLAVADVERARASLRTSIGQL